MDDNQGVQFEDEQSSYLYTTFKKEKMPPALVSWMVKTGIVTDPRHVNIILLSFITLSLLLSGVIFYKQLFGSVVAQITPELSKEFLFKTGEALKFLKK